MMNEKPSILFMGIMIFILFITGILSYFLYKFESITTEREQCISYEGKSCSDQYDQVIDNIKTCIGIWKNDAEIKIRVENNYLTAMCNKF